MITANDIKAAFVAARLNGTNAVLLNADGMNAAELQDVLERIECKRDTFTYRATATDKPLTVGYAPFFRERIGLHAAGNIDNQGIMRMSKGSHIALEAGVGGFDDGLWIGVTVVADAYTRHGAPIINYEIITYNGD